jgi:hypothetical protein
VSSSFTDKTRSTGEDAAFLQSGQPACAAANS